MQFSEELAAFCAKARQAPVEISLRELLDLFVPREGDDPRLLGRLKLLQPALDFVMLEVFPGIDDGDLEARRLVAARQQTNVDEHQLRSEIAKEEDDLLERKSSFTCCLKTLRSQPDLDPKHYRKPAVEDSCMCAIAGLLNASGGVLLIGVEDNRTVCGLDPDLLALGLAPGDVDRWLLDVRSKIDSSFFQGRMINDHIDFQFVTLEDKIVSRAVVRPRQKFALLKEPGSSDRYRIIQRQGNRTVEIKLTDAEEFFENRYLARQR